MHLWYNNTNKTKSEVLITQPTSGQINLFRRPTVVSTSYHSYHVTSRISVQCSDCGIEWMKSKYTIKEWNGRCRSCAAKHFCANDDFKAKKSARAKAQVIQQGGIPNAVHFTSERMRGEKNVNWGGGRKGENHHNWKGGITPKTRTIRESLKYKQWRTSIFNRDDYTCQLCGERGGRLHVDHHPIPFHKLFHELNTTLGAEKADEFQPLWDISNGRTLCKACHLAHGWNYFKEKNK